MDFNNPHIREIFFKNLSAILSADESVRILGSESMKLAVRELNISRDELQKWFNEWRENPKKLFSLNNVKENQELIFHICSALLSDGNISSNILQYLYKYASKYNIDPPIINSIFSNRNLFINELSIKKRAENIILSYSPNNITKSIKRPTVRINQLQTKPFYIANQITPEGLDEIQRLLMAYWLGCHAAIEGPPGVGKTQCVMEVAKILGLNVYTKTCSNRTTESNIITYPILSVQNGATITSYVNGPLVNAMIEPGIFYGDEFNQLRVDVQKRLNSAFDERRFIERHDGTLIVAKPGFWAVISYNPTETFGGRELEDSVADRFVHYYFSRWSPSFKAYIAHKQAALDFNRQPAPESSFGIKLGWRGISANGNFLVGVEENGTIQWRNFFTGNIAPTPDYIYQVDLTQHTNNITGQSKIFSGELSNCEKFALNELEFCKMLSNFTCILQSLSYADYSNLSALNKSIPQIQPEDIGLVSLHTTSARIEIAAIKHYNFLIEKGFNKYLAQAYATRLVIDQACYGQNRYKKLSNQSTYELVTSLAKSLALMRDVTYFNTNLT